MLMILGAVGSVGRVDTSAPEMLMILGPGELLDEEG
jgi:hypothetical protein